MALNFKDSGNSRLSGILLVVFLIASLLLMTLYVSEGPRGALHLVQAQVNAIVSPFKLVGATGGAAVDRISTGLGDAMADAPTLSELRQQNKELTELVTQTEEYRLEAERLQGLLNMKQAYDIRGVTGRVIGRSTDAWNQTITVDVGSADGVELGLTVLGPSGVVGQVVSVASGSSTVRLITDVQSGVSAIIQSSRAEGIVRGSLQGILFLENIDADVSVSIGDVVLTSGLGGSYTKGLLIGTVVRVEGQTGDDARKIVVAQNEQISSLEEIMVVFSASEANVDDVVVPEGALVSSSAGATAVPPASDAAIASNTSQPSGEGE